MIVYVLRLRTDYSTFRANPIIGVYSTYEKAFAAGDAKYGRLADGLVIWCIEPMEIDS